MKINLGFFINKFLKIVNRPALRNCDLDKTSKIGSGTNCINMKIGRYSYVGKNNSICNTIIGNFCSIASYCSIGGGEHPINNVSTSPLFYSGKNIFKKNFCEFSFNNLNNLTEIGNDVWIGEKVFIKAGVKIGNGAVIGAHSVVTHDVPPYAVVVGAPARIIKYRFSVQQISKLQEIEWWFMDDKKLKDVSIYFDNIEIFLKEGIK